MENAIAHTSAIRVLVGDEPIHSNHDAMNLLDTVRRQRKFYQAHGYYKLPEHRQRVLDLFDAAIAELERAGRAEADNSD